MWKSYLLYGLCVFTLLTSCNEEDIKLDASTVVDWCRIDRESWGIYFIKYIRKQEFQFSLTTRWDTWKMALMLMGIR